MDRYLDEIRFYSFDVYRYICTKRRGDLNEEIIEDADGTRKSIIVDELCTFSQLGINYNIWITLFPIRILVYIGLIIYSLNVQINLTTILVTFVSISLLFLRLKQLVKYFYFKNIMNNKDLIDFQL